MENENDMTGELADVEHTFATVNDVSRQIKSYHTTFTSDGMCGSYNRDCVRDWLRELRLTDAQINTFCDDHDIPHVV